MVIIPAGLNFHFVHKLAAEVKRQENEVVPTQNLCMEGKIVQFTVTLQNLYFVMFSRVQYMETIPNGRNLHIAHEPAVTAQRLEQEIVQILYLNIMVTIVQFMERVLRFYGVTHIRVQFMVTSPSGDSFRPALGHVEMEQKLD